MLEKLEAWTRMLVESLGIDAIYLDNHKAFDKVPHRRLLAKLSSYRIDGRMIN
jgi:hypothetical protein